MAIMAENEDLKKFKANVEEKEKNFAVDETLHSILKNSVIPEEKIKEMRFEAEKFSLENIDNWKNNCKAVAFDYPKVDNKDKKEEDAIVKYSFLWADEKKQKKSVWDD
jgi:hypothetical protein